MIWTQRILWGIALSFFRCAVVTFGCDLCITVMTRTSPVIEKSVWVYYMQNWVKHSGHTVYLDAGAHVENFYWPRLLSLIVIQHLIRKPISSTIQKQAKHLTPIDSCPETQQGQKTMCSLVLNSSWLFVDWPWLIGHDSMEKTNTITFQEEKYKPLKTKDSVRIAA